MEVHQKQQQQQEDKENGANQMDAQKQMYVIFVWQVL
jgi:hypothetical protein